MANVEKGRPFNYRTQCLLIVIIIVNRKRAGPSAIIFYVILNNRQNKYARKRDGPLTM